MQKINTALLDYQDTKNGRAVSAESHSSIRKASTLPSVLNYIVQEVQRDIGLERSELGDAPTSVEIQETLRRVIHRLGFELTSLERDEVLTQIERGSKVFGILQELVDDPATTDIIVTNFAKIAVQQGRKNLATDFAFASQQAYEAFVERILQKANTTCSTKKPIADGMIADFARIHVVHKCLCESGPYLTIRLNRFPSVNIEDLLSFDLAPAVIFKYLSAVVRAGFTVLVVGEVGSGKTTLVRALAAHMPSHESILVIEDTTEIRLEHPHVRYISTREANTDGAGKISPAECIRAGMRMAMNRIIFGEMRDAEAAEAFIDVCASGHPGLSTIHARNGTEAIARLELFLSRAQRGVGRNVVHEQISKAVQVIVFLDICSKTGKRRIFEVREIGAVADGVIRQREIFRYKSSGTQPGWEIVNKSSSFREKIEDEQVFLAELPCFIALSQEGVRK